MPLNRDGQVDYQPLVQYIEDEKKGAPTVQDRSLHSIQVCLVSNRKLKGKWSIPGGAPKHNDASPLSTVNRELNEESGFPHTLFDADDYAFTIVQPNGKQCHYYVKAVHDLTLYERLVRMRQNIFDPEIWTMASFEVAYEEEGTQKGSFKRHGNYTLLGVIHSGAFAATPEPQTTTEHQQQHGGRTIENERYQERGARCHPKSLILSHLSSCHCIVAACSERIWQVSVESRTIGCLNTRTSSFLSSRAEIWTV